MLLENLVIHVWNKQQYHIAKILVVYFGILLSQISLESSRGLKSCPSHKTFINGVIILKWKEQTVPLVSTVLHVAVWGEISLCVCIWNVNHHWQKNMLWLSRIDRILDPCKIVLWVAILCRRDRTSNKWLFLSSADALLSIQSKHCSTNVKAHEYSVFFCVSNYKRCQQQVIDLTSIIKCMWFSPAKVMVMSF